VCIRGFRKGVTSFLLQETKLTKNRKGTWHSDRLSKNGYVFDVERLEESQFIIAKELLFEIPLELLDTKLKGFNTAGNKDEDQLIIGFGGSGFQKSISIDSYEIETDKLPTEVKNFRLQVESVIIQLTNKTRY
jgi:hypothetical protein